MAGAGRLALWMDSAPGREAEFERWYQSEHLAERLAVPGFLRGRRHEAVEAGRGYFCNYEVEAPGVLTSEAYRARLGAPTPLTGVIMSEAMRNMSRTICRLDEAQGAFRGAFAVTAELMGPSDAATRETIDALAADPGTARIELWSADAAAAGPVTDEERLRGGDAKVAGCLLIETLREADARLALQSLRRIRSISPDAAGLFRLLCELGPS